MSIFGKLSAPDMTYDVMFCHWSISSVSLYTWQRKSSSITPWLQIR